MAYCAATLLRRCPISSTTLREFVRRSAALVLGLTLSAGGLAAVRKHARRVQVGTQIRSAPFLREAVQYVRSGAMGPVIFGFILVSPSLVRSEMKARSSSAKVARMWMGNRPLGLDRSIGPA